jgi:hypothetical protein
MQFSPRPGISRIDGDEIRETEWLRLISDCNGVRGKPKVLERYRVQDAGIPGAKMLGAKMLGAKTEATTIKGGGLVSQSSK